MTIDAHPALYIYAPDGSELMASATIKESAHIPREGELLRTTDHSKDGASTITFTGDDKLRVTSVSTEFRLTDNIGRGQSWTQIIKVETEKVADV